MEKSAMIIFLGIALVGLAAGQLERCHTTILTPFHFLNPTKFSGVWYTLEVAPSKSHQVKPLNYSCQSFNLSLTDDQYRYNIVDSYTVLENGTAVGSTTEISTVRTDDVSETRPPHPAIWNVYQDIPGTNETQHAQAVVLATDDSSWAVMYSCVVQAGELLERVFITSRKPTLEPLIQETLATVAHGLGFPRSHFTIVDQTQC